MSSEPRRARTSGEFERILAAFQPELAPAPPPPTSVEDRLKSVRVEDAKQNVVLKKILAWGSMLAVAIQLIAANYFFHRYGNGMDWRINTEVMISWLTATVVQSTGVIYVIAKHLFPEGENLPQERSV